MFERDKSNRVLTKSELPGVKAPSMMYALKLFCLGDGPNPGIAVLATQDCDNMIVAQKLGIY